MNTLISTALFTLLEAAAKRAGSLEERRAAGDHRRGIAAEIAGIRRAIRELCPDLNQRSRLLTMAKGRPLR